MKKINYKAFNKLLDKCKLNKYLIYDAIMRYELFLIEKYNISLSAHVSVNKSDSLSSIKYFEMNSRDFELLNYIVVIDTVKQRINFLETNTISRNTFNQYDGYKNCLYINSKEITQLH